MAEAAAKAGRAFKVVILLAGFMGISDCGLSAAYSTILASYPEASGILFNLFMSGPMLTLVLGALLTPAFSRSVSAKRLLVISYLVFSVCSTTCAWAQSFAFMVAMRLIVGFCMGISGTVTFALIADVYNDERERSQVMGLSSATGGIMGVVLGAVGGWLASLPDWHPVFLPLAFGFVVLLLVIAVIPDVPPEREVVRRSDEDGSLEPFPLSRLLPLFLAFFAYGTLYIISNYYTSFYFVEAGMSEAEAAFASGMFTSVGSVSGIIGGIVFGRLFMTIRRWTPALCLAITAVAYLMYCLTADLWVVFAMAFLASFAYTVGCTYYITEASLSVSPAHMTLTMAVLTSAMSIGAFISTFLMDAIVQRVGSIMGAYQVIGATLAIGAVISSSFALRAHHRVKLWEDNGVKAPIIVDRALEDDDEGLYAIDVTSADAEPILEPRVKDAS